MERDVNEIFKDAETEAVSATDAEALGLDKTTAEVVLKTYEEKCANDPTVGAKAYSLSKSLELVNTLGTHKEGEADSRSSLVYDAEATAAKKAEVIKAVLPELIAEGKTEEEALAIIEENIKAAKKSKDTAFKKKYSCRVVKKTTGICGYVFKNIGTAPIKYMSQKCTKGADGVWTVAKEAAVAQPGETFIVTRVAAVALGTQSEFSFLFANARVVARNKDDIKKYIQSSYINFNEKGKTVHDADVKIVIDKVNKDGGVTVDKKYASVFGYLENEIVKAPKAPKTPKTPEDKAKKQMLLQAAIADNLATQLNQLQ